MIQPNPNPPSYTAQLQGVHNRRKDYHNMTALALAIISALVLAGGVCCTVTGGLALNATLYGPGILLSLAFLPLVTGSIVNRIKAKREFIPPSAEALITALTQQEAPVPMAQITDQEYRTLLGIQTNPELRVLALSDPRVLEHLDLLSNDEVINLLGQGRLTVNQLPTERYGALLHVQGNSILRLSLLGDPRRFRYLGALSNDEVIAELLGMRLPLNLLPNGHYEMLLRIQGNNILRARLLADPRRWDYSHLLSDDEVIVLLAQGHVTVEQLDDHRFAALLRIQGNNTLRVSLLADPRCWRYPDFLSNDEVILGLVAGNVPVGELTDERLLILWNINDNPPLKQVLIRDHRVIEHLLYKRDFEMLHRLPLGEIPLCRLLSIPRFQQWISNHYYRLGQPAAILYIHIANLLRNGCQATITTCHLNTLCEGFINTDNNNKIAIMGLFQPEDLLLSKLLTAAKKKLEENRQDERLMEAIAARPEIAALLLLEKKSPFPGRPFYEFFKAVFDRIPQENHMVVRPHLAHWPITAAVGNGSLSDLVAQLEDVGGVPPVLTRALSS